MSSPPDADLRCLSPLAEDSGHVLRADHFLEPRHLVGLAAVSDRFVRRGLGALRLQLEPETAHYAARMRLAATLDLNGCTHGLPDVNARPRGDDLLEVREVDGPDGARAMARLTRARVRPGSPWHGEPLDSLLHRSCGEGCRSSISRHTLAVWLTP